MLKFYSEDEMLKDKQFIYDMLKPLVTDIYDIMIKLDQDVVNSVWVVVWLQLTFHSTERRSLR